LFLHNRRPCSLYHGATEPPRRPLPKKRLHRRRQEAISQQFILGTGSFADRLS
jgi:hypothetical protein